MMQWDPKITTLPGLYLLSVGVLMPLSSVMRVDLCGTYALRMTNVFACFANFYIIYNIQKRLYPERRVCKVHMYWNNLTFILSIFLLWERQGSTVGIVTGNTLDHWGLRVQFLVGAGNFCLLHHVQTGAGAHPASFAILGALSLGLKQLGSEADYSPSCAEAKNAWCYISTPPPVHLQGMVLS
jgi:hypothetical protein